MRGRGREKRGRGKKRGETVCFEELAPVLWGLANLVSSGQASIADTEEEVTPRS